MSGRFGRCHHRGSRTSLVMDRDALLRHALSPDGSRLYFNGPRAYALGVSYELTAPAGTKF